MKRHKRKQKQWDKKTAQYIARHLVSWRSQVMASSFPELSLLDRMKDDQELTELFKDKPHE